MTELAGRLREQHERYCRADGYPGAHTLYLEAADALKQMREALEPFASVGNNCALEPDETVLYTHQCVMGDLHLTIGHFRAALKALSDGSAM